MKRLIRAQSRRLHADLDRASHDVRNHLTSEVAAGRILAADVVALTPTQTLSASCGPTNSPMSWTWLCAGKQITVMAIHKLVECGSLDPDAPILLSGRQLAVTVTQLLQHRITHDESAHRPAALMSVSEAAATAMTSLRPNGGPTTSSYSDWMSSLVLGQVIEAVTGVPYFEAVRQLVLNPLGATVSFIEDVRVVPEPIGFAYASVTGVGATGKARSLALLCAALGNSGPRLFGSESVRRMVEPQFTANDDVLAGIVTWTDGFIVGNQQLGLSSPQRSVSILSRSAIVGFYDPVNSAACAIAVQSLPPHRSYVTRHEVIDILYPQQTD